MFTVEQGENVVGTEGKVQERVRREKPVFLFLSDNVSVSL